MFVLSSLLYLTSPLSFANLLPLPPSGFSACLAWTMPKPPQEGKYDVTLNTNLGVIQYTVNVVNCDSLPDGATVGTGSVSTGTGSGTGSGGGGGGGIDVLLLSFSLFFSVTPFLFSSKRSYQAAHRTLSPSFLFPNQSVSSTLAPTLAEEQSSRVSSTPRSMCVPVCLRRHRQSRVVFRPSSPLGVDSSQVLEEREREKQKSEPRDLQKDSLLSLLVWAGGVSQPSTSSSNYQPPLGVFSSVYSSISSAGELNIFANVPTHVVFDVSGYFQPTSGLFYQP